MSIRISKRAARAMGLAPEGQGAAAPGALTPLELWAARDDAA